MSAFAPEIGVLLEQTEVENNYLLNGRTFTTGTLAGNDVVLFLSGISMVNAAMTSQLALDHFNITHIIFSGIAGGVNPELHLGDVTVPTQWAQYQEQFFAREDGDSDDSTWQMGWHGAPYGNYGMMFPQDVDVTARGMDADSIEEKFWFAVDDTMLEVVSSLEDITFTTCNSDNTCLEQDPQLVIGGTGVSGSTFVDNGDYRRWVWETFNAQALDMETAAVAHVAYANEVPYIAFRSLSDLAGGGDGANELPVFLSIAAQNSAALVVSFLTAWADQP
jgi:adenosylhomocysteine nucleosidase